MTYIEQLRKTKQPKQFEKEFGDVGEDITQVLKGLFEINPYFRLSAEDLVANPIFDNSRVPFAEKIKPKRRVKLAFDGPECYNYGMDKDLYFKQRKDIRQAILMESRKVKKWAMKITKDA